LVKKMVETEEVVESITLEEKHSVKFSLNAKNLWAAEVKCYGLTPEEAFGRAKALAEEVEKIIIERNGG